jgi:cytochrome c oxidase assembly factor CtaG
VAGYVIAILAFALPFVFGVTGVGRARTVLSVGVVLALGWVASMAASRATDSHGSPVVPLWFLTGLVVLLYLLWCGGLWLGLRLRRLRAH